MAEDQSRELTLYVQSKKVVTSFYHPPTPSGSEATGVASPELAPGHTGTEASPGSHAFFLSDDQARCVAITEELASKRGYKLEVVDVAKVGRLERLVTERLRGVQTFPVLVAGSGARLEGFSAFTEERLAEIMPTELTKIRAFTYLKVRGGDLDRIRQTVLNFVEVKEVHLLTGDWDLFVVLEFTHSTTNKRQVLDFVTEHIRGIPDVLDTSTLVPEFSVTKFPV